MPKIVDPDQRRSEIADAVLALVARDGLEAATLRNVAEQAGLAIGSVRHYFDSHESLIIFAVEELNRRINHRVREHAERILGELTSSGRRDERRRLTEELLAEWLPWDEVRHREAVLRHTFTIVARTRPSLRPHAESLRDSMSQIIRRVLTEARASGGLPPGVDITFEGARLCALLDGLSLQAVAAGSLTPSLQREILNRHLDTLP